MSVAIRQRRRPAGCPEGVSSTPAFLAVDSFPSALVFSIKVRNE
jgi:hypothetical protein